MQTGMVSEYSEVYSFGHVLLELLVNKPPAVKGQAGELIYPVLQAVKPLCPGAHGRLLQHLDPMANWPPAVANEFADMALCCIDTVPERRPVFEDLIANDADFVARTRSTALFARCVHGLCVSSFLSVFSVSFCPLFLLTDSTDTGTGHDS